jgi:hypothetical protein
MTKKTGNNRGRPSIDASHEALDAWLSAQRETGIGKEKWAEQNAARYRMTPEALVQHIKRRLRFVNQLV